MGFVSPSQQSSSESPASSSGPSVASSASGTLSDSSKDLLKNLVCLDFESFYDSKGGYTLKKMSMLEYIKSPKFKTFGVGIQQPFGKPYWVTRCHVRAELDKIDWSRTTLVAQNVKFDGGILAWVYGHKPRYYIDTLSMARAVFGNRTRDHSLKTIAEHFKLTPKGNLNTDGLQELTQQQEKELAEYCLHDTELCWQIFERMLPMFPPSQLPVVDWTIRCFVEPRLSLDKDLLKKTNLDEKARRAKVFEEIGIDKKVFSSNQKFPALLKERGFEVPMKLSATALKKGQTKEIPALAAADEEFMEMRNSENKELVSLCEARIAAKSNLLETRSEKFLALADLGPFPFDINFSGAKQTHRSSGGSGAGGNPQNLTRGSALRAAVRAPAGYKLLVADYAAIEARIVAFISSEYKLMEIFSANGDPYCMFASTYYGREITKKDDLERRFGKTCILGLGYGMGASKFQYKARIDTGIKVSDLDAEKAKELYRSTYWRIPQMWNVLGRMIFSLQDKKDMPIPNAPFLRISDGSIILPSGLSIQYPNLHTEGDDWYYDIYRHGTREPAKLYGGKVLENISQSLAGEIKKVAIERATAAGLICVGEVHDEILALIPADRAKEGASILRRAMEDPLPWWPQIKLKADVGGADNWLDAKKKENEL